MTTTALDIARWRLRSQHLVTPYAASASAVVADLLAVQAENPGPGRVGGRLPDHPPPPGGTSPRCWTKGEAVRTHVLRPTWHFVGGGGRRVAPRAERHRGSGRNPTRQLAAAHGLDDAAVDRATLAGRCLELSLTAARPDA